MSFKTTVISALQTAVTKDFISSSEGSTGNGVHEEAVSKHFIECGFPLISKVIEKNLTSTRGKETKKVILIMDKTTHSPTPDIHIPYENGYYQIPQPYSISRGSFNPAPDLYLVAVADNKIVEWVGIECKSSTSMKPMWNDNLPRPFIEGNIIYLFTGTHKNKSFTCIFTNDVFFGGKDYSKILTVYENTRLFLQAEWERQGCQSEFPFLSAMVRTKCEQNTQITPEKMVEYNQKTILFLNELSDFTQSQT